MGRVSHDYRAGGVFLALAGVYKALPIVHHDVEGKPERALAAKYQQRADAAERLGYSRFSELLRSVASGFISEADYNACHVHEDED